MFISSGSLSSQTLTNLNGLTTWGKVNDVVDSWGEVTLTEDINVVGVIRIPEGKTLTIRSNKDIVIRNAGITQKGDKFPNGSEVSEGRSRFFTVKSGARLIIEAAEGKTITIDGGADFTWNDYRLIPGPDSRILKEAIANEGGLELTNVIIQNVKSSDQNGGGILITSSASGTVLEGCKIERCYSELGSAIMLQSVKPLNITDSQINYCHSGGGQVDNSGGAIRTYGSVSASLYLTRVRFAYNYAERNLNYDNTLRKDGNGGALFWNARGTNDTKCVLDGCLFEYNRSDDNGGAIKSQATLIFDGSPTTIENNIAPNGAGLYIEGYTGGAGVSESRTIDYDLNSNLIIRNNTAPSYHFGDEEFSGLGAGIHYFFGSDMDLEEGSTIRVNMNGATIIGNTAEGTDGLGGGIYFENTSIEGKYNFEINLSFGSLESNTSAKGGGIYVYKGEVQSVATQGEALTVTGNTATAGAGLYIKDGSLSMANGLITSNTVSDSGNGGGIYIENGDFTIDAGEVSGNTLESGQGAGVYIVGSDGKGNFTMNGGEIKENATSGNNGGGVYINGGNFTLNSGSITGNSAEEGGGVYLNNGNFSLVTGEISGNTASGNGGGVYLVGEDCEYRLKNGTITGNQGKNGGGVYLANGSFILADNTSDIGSISGNTASGYGGGVYIAGDGDFTMNGGMVKENKTTGNHGGGIFLNGGNFSLRNGDILDNLSNSMGGGVYLYGGTFIMEDGNIAGNSSTSEGGGACIVNNGNFTMNDGNIVRNHSNLNGGGVYLDGGTLTVSAGTISNNASTANGGGLYIMNGTVTMGSGMIQENECGQYGGGVYVYNSSSDQKTVTFNGGTLSGNSAKYGGGVCVDGLILMTIGNVEIAENTATNGGGVCLMNSAYMEFGIGQIKNNTALTQTAFNTGFQKEIYEIEGFGGGVYLGSGTTLVFNYATDLGLFGNLADNGGDEIFANGNNTSVDLPDVTYMALGGYPGASNLKWIEDYPTNDPSYGSGTKLKGNVWDTDKTNLRYRETISQNAPIYNLSGETKQDKRYICFALGYEVIYITITRYGLDKGESAIYHIRKNEANDFNIILTGDGSESVTKKAAVTAGEWTVSETGWGWTQNLTDLEGNTIPDGSITKDIAEEENRLFVFKGTKKSDLPMNHEDIVINIMGI